jgi:hypothetical protein
MRIRILDVSELKPEQWYLDMHHGNYKPDYPMAGVIECVNDAGEWKPIDIVPPPSSKEELTEIIRCTP